MNENINLCKILKYCPKGTTFWSPLFGNAELIEARDTDILVKTPDTSWIINSDGTISIVCFGLSINSVEIMLFPSKDQLDWSKWKCPKPKFDPKTLKTFDKVLVRLKLDKDYIWMPNIFSYHCNNLYYTISGYFYNYILPYNEDTKHLVGKMEDAPEYYRYWES